MAGKTSGLIGLLLDRSMRALIAERAEVIRQAAESSDWQRFVSAAGT